MTDAAENARPARVAAVVLAAGLSSRMQGPNKLLAEFRGAALIRHAVAAACASKATRVFVVTGHQADAVVAALRGLPVGFISNPDYTEGMAASIRAAVAALDGSTSAALFCLADMPLVTPALLNSVIDAHAAHRDALACQPVHAGKPGNPVLWSAAAFAELAELRGAEGARGLLQGHASRVHRIEVAVPGIHVDLDTPDDFAAQRGSPRP